MNVKIKDAWEKAAQVHSGDSWAEQTAFLEKFAELIVRECSNLVFEYGGGTDSDEGKLYDLCNQIEKHFGVEE